MRRIIYQSRAGSELDRAELFRLLYQARVANEERGLTGVLLHSQGRFLQVLEGRTWKLFAAFEKIRQDPRHHEVEVLFERSIPEATFPAWPMRYFDDHDVGKMLNCMTSAAGGALPRAIEEALCEFLAQGSTAPQPFSPLPLVAAPPSSPRPC